MTQSTGMTGMIGRGFYDQNSAPQRLAIDHVLPWIDNALAEIALDGQPQTIGIADFGCSEGANSMHVLQRAVQAFRARAQRAIFTMQSDLPTNDYTGLLKTLRPEGRAVFGEGTFNAVVGGSMFNQLLPPSSLHLATTFNAIAFLTRRPVDRLTGNILPNGPSPERGAGYVDSADAAVFKAQAAADLESFFRVRAAELVPGEKLLIQVFGGGDEGHTCDGMYDALNDALLADVEAGVIERDAYDIYYQPVYMRSLEELAAPVTGNGPQRSAFHLETVESYPVPVPFVEAYNAGGDVAVFAKACTAFYRAFTESTLVSWLAPGDDGAFADRVYGRAAELLRANPGRYPMRYFGHAILLTRR